MISIVQQRKRIEKCLVFKFNLIDDICEKGYCLCSWLITYLEDDDFESFIQLFEDDFKDDFVSLLPFPKTDILVYQALREYISACNEFIERYKNSDKVYRHRKLGEYRDVLALKRAYIKSYKRIVKRIGRDFRRKIENQFPELIKSIYNHIVSEITNSSAVLKEFNDATLDLIKDIEHAYHTRNFDELEMLNGELLYITHNFLYNIKSELLELLGYNDHEGEGRTDKILKERIVGIE